MGTFTPITALAPIPLVSTVNPSEAVQAREHLEHLLSLKRATTFDIARQLWFIKSYGFYTTTTFKEYLDTLEPKIKERTSQYLTKMIQHLDYLDVPPEIYEPVGLEKLRLITSLNPEDTWTDPETGEAIPMGDLMLGFIKNYTMSIEAMREHIKVLKGQVGDQDIVRRSFTMTQQVAEQVVDPALNMARMQLGSTHKDDEGISQDASDGACLEVVAVSFLLDPANQILAEGVVLDGDSRSTSVIS
jgi:hypothetical protein